MDMKAAQKVYENIKYLAVLRLFQNMAFGIRGKTSEGAVKATCGNEMGENCDWLAGWVTQLQNSVVEAECHI